MPRTTKPKPVPTHQPVPESGAVNGAPDEVLTLAEVASYLRLNDGEVVRLVREQNLPGRLAGTEWRFLKSAIQGWLSLPMPITSKEAQLAVAGAWEGDPEVERELKEIMSHRGRSTPGDEE